MSTCTPIYGLPYIVGTDAPCNQDDTWCAFTAAVETQLDRFDTIVDRTADTIPQFQVSTSAGYTFPTTSRNVGFDTVNADTDNIVDLVGDPFSFSITRVGRWFLYFNVSTTGNTAIQGNIPVSVVNSPSLGSITITQDYQDNGTNYPASINASGYHRYPNTGARVSLSVSTAATAILSATFGGYWMGDL